MEGVFLVEVIDGKITHFYAMRNPEKLTAIARPAEDQPLAFCHAYPVRIERLGDLGSAPAVLRAVADAAARRGLAPPAALIGEWFGSGAVIAPSLTANPVGVGEVFDVSPGAGDAGAVGGGWFGYLSYPDAGADGRPPRLPEAAGGWTDCVLRQDSDGHWWYESLSGAPLSDWVADAVRNPLPPRSFDITWGDADREAHRRGVLECLDAIAAGEVYQACVCTQFAGRLRRRARRLLRRRRGTHFPRPRGVSGRRLGRGGVAVARSCSCGAPVTR